LKEIGFLDKDIDNPLNHRGFRSSSAIPKKKLNDKKENRPL